MRCIIEMVDSRELHRVMMVCKLFRRIVRGITKNGPVLTRSQLNIIDCLTEYVSPCCSVKVCGGKGSTLAILEYAYRRGLEGKRGVLHISSVSVCKWMYEASKFYSGKPLIGMNNDTSKYLNIVTSRRIPNIITKDYIISASMSGIRNSIHLSQSCNEYRVREVDVVIYPVVLDIPRRSRRDDVIDDAIKQILMRNNGPYLIVDPDVKMQRDVDITKVFSMGRCDSIRYQPLMGSDICLPNIKSVIVVGDVHTMAKRAIEMCTRMNNYNGFITVYYLGLTYVDTVIFIAEMADNRVAHSIIQRVLKTVSVDKVCNDVDVDYVLRMLEFEMKMTRDEILMISPQNMLALMLVRHNRVSVEEVARYIMKHP